MLQKIVYYWFYFIWKYDFTVLSFGGLDTTCHVMLLQMHVLGAYSKQLTGADACIHHGQHACHDAAGRSLEVVPQLCFILRAEYLTFSSLQLRQLQVLGAVLIGIIVSNRYLIQVREQCLDVSPGIIGRSCVINQLLQLRHGKGVNVSVLHFGLDFFQAIL